MEAGILVKPFEKIERFLFAAALTGLLACMASCAVGPQETATFNVDNEGITAKIGEDVISVFIPIRVVSRSEGDVEVSVEIMDLSRKVVSSASTRVNLDKVNVLARVDLDRPADDISAEKAAGYVIDYRIKAGDNFISGRRSLFMVIPKTRVNVLGPDKLVAGGESSYRILVRNPDTAKPVPGADVVVELEDKNQGRDEQGQAGRIQLFEGRTDDLGSLTATFTAPEDLLGNKKMVVRVESGGQVDTMQADVTVKRQEKVLLTTDKPMYQPGQTIHIRTLALKKPDLLPESGADVLFEVSDARGNKVFKKVMKNNDFGIASADFKLATQVNMGDYKIRAQVGDTVSEKSVTVDRYVLPKFKVSLKTDRDFYQPGQVLSGSVNAKYFFGKPVSGGGVSISAKKMDVELTEFQRVDGNLDQDGNFDFKITLPTYFVGQPLEQGDAFVLLSVQVKDGAGHVEKLEKTRPVTGSSVLIQVVPESGDPVPGMENNFYLVASDPLGRPVKATCRVETMGESKDVSTDTMGIAKFSAFPPDQGNMEISVHARADNGEETSSVFNFTPGQDGSLVLIRTDKALYKVGDTMNIRIFCPRLQNAAMAFKDRVYLDVIKDGRSVLVTTVMLKDGKGSYALDLDETLAGGFEVEAYYLGSDSNIYRDRKLVYVDPADTLHIGINADKSTYLPADKASITFEVKDADGKGVASAIGVQIVDEAVFALMDFRPGLEKVFYALEDDIMNPRYEIHGFDWNDVVQGDEQGGRREEAAEVLLAATGDGGFGVSIDTYAGLEQRAIDATLKQLDDDMETVRQRMKFMLDSNMVDDSGDAAEYVLYNGNRWTDPWGNLYRFEKLESGAWNSYSLCATVSSNGMDQVQGTNDDLKGAYCFSRDWSEMYALGKGHGGIRPGDRKAWQDEADKEGGINDNFGGDADVDMDADTDMDSGECDNGDCGTPDDSGGGGVRVRNYFPETLYVNPSIITDSSGMAQIQVPLADSITTWRLTALASSMDGRLGSNQSGLTVFQDFFVDIDFPASITRNDELSVPVAIYNYLDQAQDVTLSVETGDWFELLDAADKTVHLESGDVTVEYFRIKASRVGWHKLTVYAYGSELSDAVARSVEVRPDGKEVSRSFGGRLNGTVAHEFEFPTGAVPGADKLLVKIYPGMFSQVLEGLDSILRMPSGCFEQTSSATYPNVMVLDYMMSTGQVTPEIELKARGYISQGYQRLLTFEVPGGGFEWFGNPPAHNILTAYGLLEFSDMSRVFDVDRDVITRTQKWLADQQSGDGSFKPTSGGIAEGAINNYKDDLARTTAYITYALLESKYDGPEVSRAIGWLKAHRDDADDPYSMAMFANALLSYSTSDPVGLEFLDDLHESAITDGDKVYWEGRGESTTYGQGDVMAIETTALVGYAMIRAGVYPGDISGVLNYLASKKDSFGNWSTTQATVLALKTMLAAESFVGKGGAADITIFLDSNPVKQITIDEETSDVLRLVDLSDLAGPGKHEVKIESKGDGTFMYQVVAQHYMPWNGQGGRPGRGTLAIDVKYDKTQLETDDIVNVRVTVENTVQDGVAKMVLVDIGLPPGFELLTGALKDAVSNGELQKFEHTERQLILYVEKIKYGEPLVVDYQLKAKYPVKASTGKAEAHPYYDPEDSSESGPVEMVVSE